MTEADGNSPADNRADGAKSAATEADLAARKAKLDAALRSSQAKEEAKSAPPKSSMVGYAAAFRLSTEFIAGIVVGLMIGWLIDYAAGTSPFGLIVFLLLGFAAGIFNVLRSAGMMADPHSRLPSAEMRARGLGPKKAAQQIPDRAPEKAPTKTSERANSSDKGDDRLR